jgi:inhibitor of KinA
MGWDLEELAEIKNITVPQLIEIHTQGVYEVFGLGFLPGFMYLGGLDERLHFPRKSAPRKLVSKGAVGIAAGQTGIYPNESPGGWNIIGNSPLNFFDVSQEAPCFVNTGDQIKFYEVDSKNYDQIKEAVDHGAYHPKYEYI